MTQLNLGPHSMELALGNVIDPAVHLTGYKRALFINSNAQTHYLSISSLFSIVPLFPCNQLSITCITSIHGCFHVRLRRKKDDTSNPNHARVICPFLSECFSTRIKVVYQTEIVMVRLTNIQGLTVVIEITTSAQGCNLSLDWNLKEVCVLWKSILGLSHTPVRSVKNAYLFIVYLQCLKYRKCDDF